MGHLYICVTIIHLACITPSKGAIFNIRVENGKIFFPMQSSLAGQEVHMVRARATS